MGIFVVAVAYLLDLAIGDPPSFPHPVRSIGRLIEKLEGPFRAFIKNERLSGALFSCSIIIMVWLAAFVGTLSARLLNYYLGVAVSILIIYTSLAIKDLGVESMAVFHDLNAGAMNRARASLSKIVGRDTANLDEPEIIRAAVETVAENIVDGIISPLFYAFLGGAALSMAYKAVNTLDSMIGYKNKRYINFGWAAAKIDDVANFIPARLSVIFLTLAGCICGHEPRRTLKIILRDGRNNPSPNSGIPEAAMAGALGVRLGGLNYYNSAAHQKPYIGDDINPLNKEHIKEAVMIAYVASGLVVAAGTIIFLLIGKGRFL